ncbi:MAG TPA: M14 family metallopeptidase [Vicinamibacterales bacterium]|nr:M14 family metallopeptidase [Vicinamibacterales bacterium]
MLTCPDPGRTARLGSLCLLVALAATAASAQPPATAAPTEASLSPAALSEAWLDERRDYGLPALIDHALVVSEVKRIASSSPGFFSLEEIGRSVEDRALLHLSLGRGPFHVLLWSQMHGDEPTATPALLQMAEYLARHRAEPAAARILDALTIHMVPMLNPDGAHRYQRRNAQGIDVNRDALLLQTPEGRALKALRDRLQPGLGFNLHNQNWRTSAGRTGKPASFSLLSVAFDEARTVTPGRLLTKKTCAVMRDALEAFVPGQVARYDDEFEVRAFGDNVTLWGTPVVLLETGPLGGDQPDTDLVRLNFVALMAALDAVASGSVHKADAGRYESLPINASGIFAILIRGASVVAGTGVAPFTGDVGVAALRAVRTLKEGGREFVQVLRVDDLGDLRVFAGLETIDAAGMFLAPAWDEALEQGADISVPDWTTIKASPPLAPGTPANLVLLRPLGDDRYRVERVIDAEKRLGRKGN